MTATDEKIRKAIREGLNTIRLHDHDVKCRNLRKQQLREEGSEDSDASQPEFVSRPQESEDECEMET